MLVLVNAIPQSRSNESGQDSEPDVAVNPLDPDKVAATAFTGNPTGGANAPIYVSADGGHTWELRNIVPGGAVVGDISIAFSPTTNRLYAAKLPNGGSDMQVLSANDFLDPAEPPMQVLETRPNADQPWILAITDPVTSTDRLYVGYNQIAGSQVGPKIDVCLDAGAAAPVFTVVNLSTAAQPLFLPMVRVAAHTDGTIYAAFYRSSAFDPATNTATLDIVVLRDDTWASGPNPFGASATVVAGVTLVTNVILGQQRVDGGLSLAVDPGNSSRVVIAWGDTQAGTYTLHVRASTDRGQTWGNADLRTIAAATNPSVAVNSDGEIGFSYQQVTGAAPDDRWEAHLARSTTGQNWDDATLSTTPARTPVAQGQPYIGDYDNLIAVADVFHGIYTAGNTPDLANFPFGVRYQRNADFTSHQLLQVNLAPPPPPDVSMDPFYFKVARPKLTALTPSSGTAAGGFSVSLSGKSFTGAVQVTFGGVAAAFIVLADDHIEAVAPPGNATQPVVVITPGGTSNALQFTYTAPPVPVVAGINPHIGPTAGNTSVVVTGSGFLGATAVGFTAAGSPAFTVDSDTQITATSPAGNGVVDVTVTTPGGASAVVPADQFTFRDDPILRSGDSDATTGGAVTILQQALTNLAANNADFDPQGVDGQFGSNTETAVRAYQAARRLGIDGIVGANTWAAIHQDGQ